MPKKYTIDFDSIWELHQIVQAINATRVETAKKELGIADAKSTVGCLLIDISKLTEEQIKYITSDDYRKIENEQYKTLGVRVNDEKE
jgi:hypothetical protein